MNPGEIIGFLETMTRDTFGALRGWAVKDRELRKHAAPGEPWCVDAILEHVFLANHYLLMLIEKGRKKALQSDPSSIKTALDSYTLSIPRLDEIGINDSFAWECPAHMVPTGTKAADETARDIEAQAEILYGNLAMMKNGEGILRKIHMSVNRLGSLDVYQYIYFLLLHARRHIQQMEKIEKDYRSGNPGAYHQA